MPDIQDLALLEPLIEALETMAFVSPIPAEPGAAPPAQAVLVEMEFACPEYGALRLVASHEFGAMLASNLQGVDPASQEAVDGADDALRELMNVTCGVALRKFGRAADQRLHMSLPIVQPFDTTQSWDRFIALPHVSVLNADGHTIAFQITGLE